MEELLLFFMCFITIFILYEMFIIKPAKKRHKSKMKKDKDKEILEIKYLTARYKLDMDKINYNQLLQICALTSSFDIALMVSIIGFISNFILMIIGCFGISFIVIMLSYHLVYLFYKKKGIPRHSFLSYPPWLHDIFGESPRSSSRSQSHASRIAS